MTITIPNFDPPSFSIPSTPSIPLSSLDPSENLLPSTDPVGINKLNAIPTVDPPTIFIGLAFALLSFCFIVLRILCTIRERRRPKIEEYGAVVGFVFVGAYMGFEMSRKYRLYSTFTSAHDDRGKSAVEIRDLE